jgi:hypothetical protein
MPVHLFIGGLVAAGFDPSGKFLLTISHAGRGVFATDGWGRVARDPSPAYPDGGHAVGIGPIEGVSIPVTEINYETGELRLVSPYGAFCLYYKEGMLAVTTTSA